MEVPVEEAKETINWLVGVAEKGEIKSIGIEMEAFEVESKQNKSYMAGLRTVTIVIDGHTKEHWEEIERRRVDRDV